MRKVTTGYVRPLTFTMEFTKEEVVYTAVVDLHNRRITTEVENSTGRVVRKVWNFPTRDDARDFLDTIVERREMLGYRQVM